VNAANLSNPWFQLQRAALEETMNAARRMSVLPSLWHRAQRVRKGVTTSEVVYEEDRLKLLQIGRAHV